MCIRDRVEEAKVEEVKVEEAKVEEVKVEEVKPEEVKPEEVKVEEVKVEKPEEGAKPKNEVIIPSSEPPLIRIDTGNQPRVEFAEYNSFFDSENENGSDILRESSTEEIGGGLEILEDAGTPLDFGDIEDLNPISDEPVAMDSADYDVLP